MVELVIHSLLFINVQIEKNVSIIAQMTKPLINN